jgi:predicted dehydrogenase
MSVIGVAIVGCGGITRQNHLPGLALCPETRVVALCDSDPAALQRTRELCDAPVAVTRYEEVVRRDDVHAVIIATPNCAHAPIAHAAIAAGKHVLCEKPLAMTTREARAMYRAAEAAGVRHMTAFTYRFVPAMRYLRHLVARGVFGEIYHYRSARLQDWGRRPLGWRQVKALAGSGELGDMLSHRIDFAHLLVGPLQRLVADLRRFHPERGGRPSELDDWVALLAEFECGATGVLESTKLASGRGESWRSRDYVELNGSEASAVFHTRRWNELQLGRQGASGLETIPVPKEFRVWPGSPRDPARGDPLVTFRYDQAFEFIDAIRNERPCRPGFDDAVRVQQVMDAALESAAARRWVEVENREPAAG